MWHFQGLSKNPGLGWALLPSVGSLASHANGRREQLGCHMANQATSASPGRPAPSPSRENISLKASYKAH